MFTLNDKRINIDAPFTTADGVTYANLRDPEVRAAVGVVEIPEPQPPEDYSDETYYRTENDTGPDYVVFTKKSDEQIAALVKSKLDAKLALVRGVRESILNRLAGIAFAAQLTGDTATAEAFVVVRRGLLDITNGITDPALVESTVTARYAAIVAQCTPAMVSAFAQVDA